MSRRRDAIEAIANTASGFVISMLTVWALRATGAWQAPAWAISAIFAVLSFARSFGLRAVFRRWG